MVTEQKKKRPPIFIYYIILIAAVLFITTILVPNLTAPTYKKITYPEFTTMLEEGKVDRVELDKAKNKITIKPKDFKKTNKYYYTGTRDEMISKGYEPCKNCNP